MATNNNGKKTVEIKENPANAPATTPETGNQPANNGEATEKVSFWRHPFKWTKKKFEDHPVASSAVAVGGVGLLTLATKVVVEAIGGGKTDEDDEDLDDVETEDEDDEEEEEED